MKPVRILIADDHPLFLDGLRLLIEHTPWLELAGEAHSGVQAVELAQTLQPDLILMDIGMPELNGIEAARRILHTDPHIRILILTMFEDDDSLFAALQAGVSGYLLKGAGGEQTLRAVRAVANGELIFGRGVARRVSEYMQRRRYPPPDIVFPQLTARELEILSLVADGLRNRQIATRLVLAEKTVRNHISNIFNKLQVATRSDAILAARAAGLGGKQADQTD